ncbi:MAG: bifunctional diguanylate cyclase/phosphodiesterase, partial [Anaerovorax sp.]
ERIASYTKTHINGWYVVSVVPTAVVSQYAKKLIYQISIAVVVMIFVALAGICWIAKFYRESQEKLERIAFEDPLTGHCNLNKFTLECEDLFEKAHTNSYAILQFDVNNFKGINDVYGYEKGNQLLQYIGHVVNDELQGGEYWARLSTDQFICLVQYESDSSIIQRIAVISERVKNFIGDYHVELTFGIYQVKNMKLSVSSMNDKASLARLEIKKGERSCNYNFYSESIKKRIAWERDIESSFSKGIGEKEFQVFLQPKYAFRGGEIVGAEALVRWRKPGNLLVTPDKFIPILEKNGRIIKLDLYMFEEVCSLLDKWQCNLPISVNFSRVDFKQNDLEDQLLAITKKHHVNPKLLEIEITESAVIDELELLKKTILKLKSVGFIVSIDDFGSGYSSLNTLRNLDIDAIKIDRGFLDETLEEEKGKKIIKNLLIMAKELSLVTVAEGVETKEQADFLIEAGCDIAQGYYYAKPMPIEDFKQAYRKF